MSAKRRIALAAAICLGSAACFSQTPTDNQQQIEAHTRQAQSYLQQKRPDLAIPELESVVALDPKNVDAQGNLGVLLYFQNDYIKAIPHLRAALAIQPSLPKIQVLLGLAEKRTGDPAAASRDLEASLPALKGQHLQIEAGLELVDLDTASGDLTGAATILEELRQADPENKEVLYAAYQTYSDLAGESMLTLSLVAPDSAQMHQVMAHEDVRQGNTNGAIAQYREAIAVNPRLPGVHFELAEVLSSSDDLKEKQQALPEYEEALRQNPLDVKTRCRLGEIYLQKSDLPRAYSYYSKAVELQPENAEANFGLAKTLIAMNQQTKALPILERAVQLEPTNASAHYRLSTLYREQGRSEDAKRELAEFLKYKQMKEKLRAIYKEMRTQPEEIRDDKQQ
ncbi:MAG: tetratricopeptide repeat protein [Silvibacterium sp.]